MITLPEQAQALLTRQIVPGETADSVLAQLRAFADSLRSAVRFQFSIEPRFCPPLEFDAPEHRLTKAFVAASRAVVGAAVRLGYTLAVSQANLINGEAGIPCILYGPLAGDFHPCSEWVELTRLVPCAQVLLATALGVLQGAG